MLTALELFTTVGAWLYWKTRTAFALGHGGFGDGGRKEWGGMEWSGEGVENGDRLITPTNCGSIDYTNGLVIVQVQGSLQFILQFLHHQYHSTSPIIPSSRSVIVTSPRSYRDAHHANQPSQGVRVESLCDDRPFAVQLDESVEIGVVESGGVLFQFHLDYSRGGSNSEDVQAHLHVRSLAMLVDVGVQLAEVAAEKFALRREPVHDRFLVERLLQRFVVSGDEAVDVHLYCLHHFGVLGSRDSLDVLRHDGGGVGAVLGCGRPRASYEVREAWSGC
jgi:hypothetical protein